MFEQVREVWRRRDLLYYIVRFEMKAENTNKVLGFVWSFLDPLLRPGDDRHSPQPCS